MNMKAIL